MDAETITASASASTKKRGRPKNSLTIPAREYATSTRPTRLFCQLVSENVDVAIAYLQSHPKCKSESAAKYAGRALLKRGDVRALIAESKAKVVVGQGDSNPRKVALLAELELLAYQGVRLNKLHPKEKLTALRTIAEIEGWMKPKEQGAGLRATFNFHVGGIRRGVQGRTISVDVGQDVPVGGVGVDFDSNPTTSVLPEGQPDIMFVGVGLPSESESESESESAMLLTVRSALPSDRSALPTDGSPQSFSQVVDSKESGLKQDGKEANTGGTATSRSMPTGRPEASESRQPVDKSTKSLFDASNT